MFGGQSSSTSGSVYLKSFDEKPGIEFLMLNLVVEGIGVQGPVVFHLHPTFLPVTQRIFATGRSVNFNCYAWGAFALGVEFADGTRLELDLAK
ncbi:pYEATS domain-containing protein [Methylobacterium sp. EM32]|uniref:pYEATS domain-containing protein n=1 Tax=Methylobacterium sp. EM32 TaxID=3163481 RepID=UPI0033A0A431